jgi:hypothetical protein
MPGGKRSEGLYRHIVLRMLDEFDALAGLVLEGGDDLPDCRIFARGEFLLPPDDEVGGPGGERLQRERGGEEDGPDLHGTTP